MRIDKTHRPWIIATVAAAVVSTIVYIIYAVRTPGGPRGGSAIGLTFGIAGYALMLYAGLLGARKKVPIWRLGRAQTWMRGHIWLGLLTLPLILFHAGFAFRGPLTLVLMLLLFIVIASGIVGAIVQHYVPSLITTRVPMETIYEEIPHVRAQLREEADVLVASVVEVETEDRAQFAEVYGQRIRPYLANPDAPHLEMGDSRRSAEIFESLRRVLAAPVHGVLDDLENLCEEERQLSRQIRIYRWLHSWLLVHVPLSIALLVLGGVHAVMALRY